MSDPAFATGISISSKNSPPLPLIIVFFMQPFSLSNISAAVALGENGKLVVVPLWWEAGGRNSDTVEWRPLHRNSRSRRESQAFVYSRGKLGGKVMKPVF